jgi:hypothetical protein
VTPVYRHVSLLGESSVLATSGVELARVAIYCHACGHLFEMRGEGKPGGFRWIKKCGRCKEREAKEKAEIERLEAMLAARECAAPDCRVVFAPSVLKQRFHSDACRRGRTAG